MTQGLVSTIIPVYNRPRMLREAVASVLAQTYRPIEVVLVDDGSTDETPTVCAELAASHTETQWTRIPNGGPGVAREAGRQLVQGEFIQYLDSDDLLRPTKFERQIAALRSEPAAGIAYCSTYEYLMGNRPEERASFRTGERLDTLFPALLSGRIWQTVTPLFRTAVTEAVGPWSSLRQEEDWEYDARVAALGTRLAWCPEFLADHRHHGEARAGGDSLHSRDKMASRCRAHSLILDHALRSGLTSSDPNVQHYARELFLLARQCGAVGLGEESEHLFGLARVASLPDRAEGLDFRLYRLLARVIGWSALGRLTCWFDRLRLPTT